MDPAICDGAKGNTLYKHESIKVAKDVSGDYSLSHLENAIKSVKTGEIGLSIHDNFPLRLILDIPEVGEIKYYLAPYKKSE